VFHFLTDPNDRELYLQNLRRALKPGGHFILATFAEDGPLKCSGLDTERYDLQKMTDTVGPDFKLVESLREQHHTPFGTTQSFQYAHFLFGV
jgi:SAM-dependent methyltransferase